MVVTTMTTNTAQVPAHPPVGAEDSRPVASLESGAAVIALPVNRPQMMRAAEVMSTVGPGDGQAWAQELAFLWTTLRYRVLDVMDSVLAVGFREPIVLGREGRLWDGHHRLAVALALDLEVPVTYAGKASDHACPRDGFKEQ